MFKVIGGAVVYGLALFGLSVYLTKWHEETQAPRSRCSFGLLRAAKQTETQSRAGCAPGWCVIQAGRRSFSDIAARRTAGGVLEVVRTRPC